MDDRVGGEFAQALADRHGMAAEFDEAREQHHREGKIPTSYGVLSLREAKRLFRDVTPLTAKQLKADPPWGYVRVLSIASVMRLNYR